MVINVKFLSVFAIALLLSLPAHALCSITSGRCYDRNTGWAWQRLALAVSSRFREILVRPFTTEPLMASRGMRRVSVPEIRRFTTVRTSEDAALTIPACRLAEWWLVS